MKIASTAMDIDRKAKLLSKSNVYQTDFNLKLAYKNNGLEIYVKPIMKYATASLKFHDKIIIESLVDIKAKRKDYSVEAGVIKEFSNNFKLKLTGELGKDIKKVSLGLSYNW